MEYINPIEKKNKKVAKLNSHKIMDKELLTFSNLSNLEWQYSDYIDDKAKGIYRKVSDLLSPKMFDIKDENGNILKNPYYDGESFGEDVDKDRERTYQIARMRELAPIGMEYVELLDGEGAFLDQWEVVYGADNYQLAVDLCKKDKVKDIPTREKIVENKKMRKIIEITKKLGEIALEVVGEFAGRKLGGTGSFLHKGAGIDECFDKNLVKVVSEVMKSSNDDLNNAIGSFENPEKVFIQKMIDLGTSIWVEKYGEPKTELDKENLKKEIVSMLKKVTVSIMKEISFEDTKLKVVVFKNDARKEIVISMNKGEYKDKEIIPDEILLLEFLKAKILEEHYNDHKIYITGYNLGADFAKIFTIFFETDDVFVKTFNSEYSENFEGFCNFTPHDISAIKNKEYRNNILEIVVHDNGVFTTDWADYVKLAIQIAFALATPWMFLLCKLIGILISILRKWWDNKHFEDFYDKLIDLGFVNKGKVKNVLGLVEDKVFNKDITLELIVKNGITKGKDEIIKLDLESMFFLMLEHSSRLNNGKIEIYCFSEVEIHSDKTIEIKYGDEFSYPITVVEKIATRKYYTFKENSKILGVYSLIKGVEKKIGIQGVQKPGIFGGQEIVENFKRQKELTYPLKPAMLNLLYFMNIIQNAYIENRDKIESYYLLGYDKGIVATAKRDLTFYKHKKNSKVPFKLLNETNNNMSENKEYFFGPSVNVNEATFMPYISKDDGQFQDTLREEYIGTLLRSILGNSKVTDNILYSEKSDNLLSFSEYLVENYYKIKFMNKFQNKSSCWRLSTKELNDINDYILKILENYYNNHSSDSCITVTKTWKKPKKGFFNKVESYSDSDGGCDYYEEAVAMIKANPDILKKYYKIINVSDKDSDKSNMKVKILHDSADDVQFKYNCYDLLIGGYYEVDLKNTLFFKSNYNKSEADIIIGASKKSINLIDRKKPKPGDVIFFNWKNENKPEHIAIITKVDEDDDPELVFGSWKYSGDLTFKEVNITEYNKNIFDEIIGIVDMEDFIDRSTLPDFIQKWDGKKIAPDDNGTKGLVCIDVLTYDKLDGTNFSNDDGFGGKAFRELMIEDYNANKDSYKKLGKDEMGKDYANPKDNYFFRRNKIVMEFFKSKKKFTNYYVKK